MDIKRNGTQPSGKGRAEWFTGTVRIDPLFKASDPARVSGASVTFEPGARTSLFIAGSERLYVAARATGRNPAAILVFRLQPETKRPTGG